jgi:hypothetical protein
MGNGVPSASCHESTTAVTSASVMKPASGANAPDSSSSRSASWDPVSVQVGVAAVAAAPAPGGLSAAG